MRCFMRNKVLRKRSKLILSLVLAGAMALLSACGGAKNSSDDDSITSSDASDKSDKVITVTDAPDAGKSSDDNSMTSSDAADNKKADAVTPIRLVTEHRYDNYWDETDYNNIYLNAHFCHVDREYSDAYPNISKTLDEAAKADFDEAKAFYDEILNNYKTAVSAGDDPMGGWFYEVHPAIVRSDNRIVSIVKQEFSYAGGAHPDTVYYSSVYDTQSGKLLSLSDVATDTDALKKLVISAIKENYPDTAFFDELDDAIGSFFAKDGELLDWSVDYDGMTFYFSPYDIAPYAEGLICVNIPYEGNESVFKKFIMEKPDAVALSLGNGMPVFMDVNEDGKAEKVECAFYENTNEEGECCGDFILSYDDENICSEQLYAYNCDFELIRSSEGKCYLYAECTAESDYSYIRVYELNSEAVNLVDNIDLCVAGYYDDEAGYSGTIGDPCHFKLAKCTDALYTGAGNVICHIDDKGLPVKETDYYTLEDDFELTVLKDIDVREIDEVTFKTGETITLKAGERITLVRTDDLTYVDARLGDGRLVRLNVVLDTWPQLVEGKEAEKYFDGIMYAG